MADAFSSRLSRGETVAVLVWLPVHLLALPVLAALLMLSGLVSEAVAEFLVYAVGAAYMLLALRRFLRRDFDPLCDRPFRALLTVLGCYLLSRFGLTLVNLLSLALDLSASNDNNDAVIELVKADLGPASAMAVFLAPIVEECIFRAGVFGLIRRKSRVLAYAVSALVFGLYHVWSGALSDPIQLLFVLDYLPSSLALAYAYERTNSIWSSIFLHMLTNALAVAAFAAA